MNVLTTYGRVASDVTTREVNGRTVANFRFASNNRRKGDDGKYGANFYNVAAWGNLADTATRFLKKGHRATISGEMTVRTYKGSDGIEHQTVDLDANAIDLVETRAEAESKGGAAPAQAAPAARQAFTPVEDTDMPF